MVHSVSNIDGMQVSNVGSEVRTPSLRPVESLADLLTNVPTQSLTDEIALRLSKLANKALCAADAPYDAVCVDQLLPPLEKQT